MKEKNIHEHTMDKIKIITLDPSRWQENKQLRLKALQTDPASFARTYQEDAALADQQWIDWLVAAQKGETSKLLFAEYNYTLVGMVGALIDKDKQQATIIAMYVDPTMRGKGLGKQLMETMLNQLALLSFIKLITLTVNIQTLPAIALYESLGFKKINKQQNSKLLRDEYVMEKIIR